MWGRKTEGRRKDGEGWVFGCMVFNRGLCVLFSVDTGCQLWRFLDTWAGVVGLKSLIIFTNASLMIWPRMTERFQWLITKFDHDFPEFI